MKPCNSRKKPGWNGMNETYWIGESAPEWFEGMVRRETFKHQSFVWSTGPNHLPHQLFQSKSCLMHTNWNGMRETGDAAPSTNVIKTYQSHRYANLSCRNNSIAIKTDRGNKKQNNNNPIEADVRNKHTVAHHLHIEPVGCGRLTDSAHETRFNSISSNAISISHCRRAVGTALIGHNSIQLSLIRDPFRVGERLLGAAHLHTHPTNQAWACRISSRSDLPRPRIILHFSREEKFSY